MNNNFANNLKKIRKEHNLSQEQLAEELGVSRQAISKWESSVAYPEMDKIITICKKYDVNIDDLLHRDINDVKTEKESKDKYNKLVNDVLNNITDSVDMFIRLSLKNKVRCLLENIILFCFFAIGFVIVNGIAKSLFHEMFSLLPNRIYYYVTGVLLSVIFIAYIALVVVIMLRVFKIRYLDYYKKNKNNKKDDKPESDDNIETKDKNILSMKEDKIIIRDPKHSDYSILNLLVNLFFFGIKVFNFFILLFVLGIILFGSFCTFIAIYHIPIHEIFGGLTFLGLFGILGCVCFSIMLFGFIFNKKNNLKLLFILFLCSLIGVSFSAAYIFMKSTQFQLVDVDTKVDVTNIKFSDDLIYKPNRVVSGNSVYFEIDNSINKELILVETSHSNEDAIEVDINDNVISTHFNSNNDSYIELYNYLIPYIKENTLPRETIFGNNVTIKGNEANIKKIIANSTKNTLASVVEKDKGYIVTFSNHQYDGKVVCSKKDFYYSCVGIIADYPTDEDEIIKTTFEYDGKELKYKNNNIECKKIENELFMNSYICEVKD